MDLVIYSQWGGVWTGAYPATMSLEGIFRHFNRVEESDNERLEAIGYTLPSLTGGDVVQRDGTYYLCESVGWTAAEEPVARALIALFKSAAQARQWDVVARAPAFSAVQPDGSIRTLLDSGWARVTADGVEPQEEAA